MTATVQTSKNNIFFQSYLASTSAANNPTKEKRIQVQVQLKLVVFNHVEYLLFLQSTRRSLRHASHEK